MRHDEFQRLLERVRVAQARVEYVHAERDVGQDPRITVDLIDGVQHRLDALDALVLLDGAADPAARALLVHREEAADDDVAGEFDELGLRVAEVSVDRTGKDA